MARGGKRLGAGRKQAGDRVAVLVRLDRDLEQRIDQLRNGKSMSSTVERLLRSAVNRPVSDEDNANRALGFVVEMAAMAAKIGDKTWSNDPATKDALKLALPHIVDLVAPLDAHTAAPVHPLFNSPDQHARMILFWIINRLKESADDVQRFSGDEIGREILSNNAWLRNFPKAAAALKFEDDK